MREIKFRFWDTEFKKMFKDHDMVMKHITMNEFFCGNKYPLEFMQFTGLQDVTGKDIYEGDIVEFDYYESERNIYENIESGNFGKIQYHANNCSYNIVFSKDNLCISIGDEDTGYGLEVNIATRLKVIGNSYENPELLERGRGVAV